MTTSRANVVTSTDIALLRSLAQERSLVAASRRVGISRDRAVYRVERLERAFGGPVVRGARGGVGHGGSFLTPLGDRIVRGGFDAVELIDAHPLAPLVPTNLLHGVYHASPHPEVRVGRSLRLRVAFPAREGEVVSVLLDPEAVLVARRHFPSSARNVVSGIVESVHPDPGNAGVTVAERAGFADHHHYTAGEAQALIARAEAANLLLLTTEKDWVKLPPNWRERVAAWPVEARFEDEAALMRLVAGARRGERNVGG
jgi:molybdate transport repressor ModE-like protein